MDFNFRIFEAENMVEMKEVIEEIKKFAKEFKNQNGHSPLPSNKEFNLWIVSQFLELKGITASNRAKIKMLCWIYGAMIPVFILIITLIK